MKPIIVEFRKNGAYQLILKGGDEIDAALLEAMAKATEANPASLKMSFADGAATISAEVRKRCECPVCMQSRVPSFDRHMADHIYRVVPKERESFIRLDATLTERERCAKIAEEDLISGGSGAQAIAARIRSGK